MAYAKLSYCTWTWTTLGGVEGYKVTAENGNVLFLPAAGHLDGTKLNYAGNYGYYWSSDLYYKYDDGIKYYDWAGEALYFYSSIDYDNWDSRCYGQSVRPVTE